MKIEIFKEFYKVISLARQGLGWALPTLENSLLEKSTVIGFTKIERS